jgi:hypothetical protein
MVKLETDSGNSSSDTQSTSSGEMSIRNPLDSWSQDSNNIIMQPYMVEDQPNYNISYCLYFITKT